VSTHGVRVLFFAAARDVVGLRELEMEIEAAGTTVAQLRDALVARFPGLGPHVGSIRLAVNGEYAKDHDRVTAGDEVAVIPPVAGG
jgi:molybdopterin converting factor subunit 1